MLYFYCFRRILSYCVVAGGGDGELLRNQVKRAGAVGGEGGPTLIYVILLVRVYNENAISIQLLWSMKFDL